jgi:succinoglycan biosynthesis protein ExoL
MLALGRVVRKRFAASAVLAYECLDIHHLMVAQSAIGAALRRLEARLLSATDMLIVSSPAFLREHLQPMHGVRLPPTCLIENKVLQTDAMMAAQRAMTSSAPGDSRQPGPPWRIGWYGVLRCRRSLELLADLTRHMPDRIFVELRGRPARTAIPDFDELVAAAPGLRFHGAYDRQHDLAEIYQSVHFAWAIDFYEAGANSRWLLPNRLYEGGLYGAIPLALATVETGGWLARHGAGVLLHEPLADELTRYFDALGPASYARAARDLAAVPRTSWIDEGDDGARLAEALGRKRGVPADAAG